eukprot:jgi/Tetstr1/454824/TSEL_041704.t1
MIRNGVRISFKNGPPAPFNQGVSMEDATPDQLRFTDEELARFLASGAWEKGHGLRWVSRLFLVPKPGVNKWRLIIDLRPFNRYCEGRSMSFETLTRLCHVLARPDDYMLSMDLQDGFYAVGIAPEDRDYFTVSQLPRQTLPAGGAPHGVEHEPLLLLLTAAFKRHLRRPDFVVTSQGVRRAKLSIGRRQALRSNFRGCRMLPYMDDFLFFASI